MVASLAFQILGGYSALSFACGILFGGCFVMLYTSIMFGRLLRDDTGTKPDA